MDCKNADTWVLESVAVMSSTIDKKMPVLPSEANGDWAKAAYPNTKLTPLDDDDARTTSASISRLYI